MGTVLPLPSSEEREWRELASAARQAVCDLGLENEAAITEEVLANLRCRMQRLGQPYVIRPLVVDLPGGMPDTSKEAIQSGINAMVANLVEQFRDRMLTLRVAAFTELLQCEIEAAAARINRRS